MEVSKHYDLLVENGNDPFLDCKELSDYMDKWDGQVFLDLLELNKTKSVLEIGCGTGRIAKKIVNKCNSYIGIDVSPKTINLAQIHFSKVDNADFICGDFINHSFVYKFDVICSTLTFMHVKNKSEFLNKVYNLLKPNGRFVLSIDKNQRTQLDTGYSKIQVYPDNPENVLDNLIRVGFNNIIKLEIENAFLFSAQKI